MRGITNAQGVTGPDLAEILNGYVTQDWLQNFNPAFQSALENIEYLLAQTERLKDNPPVGSVTAFAGFDWVVVHWDTVNERVYLMLKGLYTQTAWADSAPEHVSYDNSNVKAELLGFESLLGTRLFTNPVFFEQFDLSRTLIKKDGSYAFLPTKAELNGFSLFRQKAVSLSDNNVSFCGNAIALDAGGNACNWWVSPDDATADNECHYVTVLGGFAKLPDVSAEADSSHQYGVRPFICMKMR